MSNTNEKTAPASDEIAAMRKVVEALPHTADGKPIVPGMTVYAPVFFMVVRGIVVDDDGKFATVYGFGKSFMRAALSELFANEELRTARPRAGEGA